MAEPITISTVLGWIRDTGTIILIAGLVWKGRGAYDYITGLGQKIEAFMESMTTHADTVVNNHLKHLEDSGTRIEKKLDEQTAILKQAKVVKVRK